LAEIDTIYSHLRLNGRKLLPFVDMELHQIETDLQNPDFQYRLKAISALKDYPPEVAVPLLTEHVQDPEFLVRSFVARELGNQQTSESFAALLELVKLDNTPNVRAEAANSISLFGKISAPHLVQIFFTDDHWLTRRSILAALSDLECHEELLEVCVQALAGEDEPVRETAVDALGALAGSDQHMAGLAQILALQKDESPHMRVRVAYALKHFDDSTAKDALAQLRQDEDHRVVGATMENLLP
jgi:HEAT repeat protein